MQPLGRLTKVQVLGDGDKVAQMPQFHGIDSNDVSIREQTCIGQKGARPASMAR
jgi:hypothetical protein